MQVTLKNLSAVRVAYMRHVGPYGLSINQFWTRTFMPWCQSQGFSGALSYYGIGLDDPDFTPPAQCRYDACVQISDDLMVSAPASVAMLPGGRYAVAQFNGPVREMPIAWTRLLREWMPASGLQMDSRPAFEHMVADSCFDAARGTITCDLCVSVRPL
mgnify:FL=1